MKKCVRVRSWRGSDVRPYSNKRNVGGELPCRGCGMRGIQGGIQGGSGGDPGHLRGILVLQVLQIMRYGEGIHRDHFPLI